MQNKTIKLKLFKKCHVPDQAHNVTHDLICQFRWTCTVTIKGDSTLFYFAPVDASFFIPWTASTGLHKCNLATVWAMSTNSHRFLLRGVFDPSSIYIIDKLTSFRKQRLRASIQQRPCGQGAGPQGSRLSKQVSGWDMALIILSAKGGLQLQTRSHSGDTTSR